VVECQLPKLDVVGSNPISRSIFSITYEDSSEARVRWSPLSTNRLLQRIHSFLTALE
jgi:hypothetical protein